MGVLVVTLQKIADASGVSINAVSRILSGHNKENRPSSIARAKRVRQTAKELGYRPNAAAKAMKDGAFRSVMLLKSNVLGFGHLPDEVLSSIQQSLADLGYKLMITVLPEFINHQDDPPVFFRESSADGVLISITRAIPPWLGNLLDDIRIPKVWLGSKQENDCIRHDDFASGYDAAMRFISLGHRRVVYADLHSAYEEQTVWHFSVVDRMEGYVKAMREAGLEPIVVRPTDVLKPNVWVEYAWRSILCKYHPTAVLAYGMEPTGRAILYACARHNIGVPHDLSFLTWSEQPWVENDIELSSYIPSKADVGKVAAELIYELMQTPESKRHPPCILPFDFSEGGSLAPVSTTG